MSTSVNKGDKLIHKTLRETVEVVSDARDDVTVLVRWKGITLSCSVCDLAPDSDNEQEEGL